MANLDKARYLAEANHKGQYRFDGEDYFNHCERVQQILSRWGEPEETQCLGYMHDLYEDTKCQDIRDYRFSDDLHRDLLRLTDPSRHFQFQINRNEKLDLKIRSALSSKRATIVKIADRIDNVNSCTKSKSISWIATYINESYYLYNEFEKVSGNHMIKYLDPLFEACTQARHTVEAIFKGKKNE